MSEIIHICQHQFPRSPPVDFAPATEMRPLRREHGRVQMALVCRLCRAVLVAQWFPAPVGCLALSPRAS